MFINLFVRQFKHDFFLWLYFLAFQQIGRLVFIAVFFNQLQDSSTLKTILTAALFGSHFDSRWATLWVLLPLILTCLCASLPFKPQLHICSAEQSFYRLNRFRPYWAGLFTLITAALFVAHIEFYREYKALFNQMIFGLWYDDFRAILITLWKSYHPLPYFALIAGLTWAAISWFSSFQLLPNFIAANPRSRQCAAPFKKTFCKNGLQGAQLVLICLFYVVVFRGSVGTQPIQLRDAFVTPDPFLNKAIASPYSALRYAINEHLNLDSEVLDKTRPPVLNQAKAFFQTQKTWGQLSRYMEKTALGSPMPKPTHIFLIVGESLDNWPLQEAYRPLNLLPQLQKLSYQGLSFPHFLPAGECTIAALNTLISGLLQANVFVHDHPSAAHPYATSLAPQFKRLGYKPQFFYGGPLSWHRIGEFTKNQGFESVFGIDQLPKRGFEANEWGIDDRALFEFVLKRVNSEKEPTFNLIMTTSNHPPFSIRLKQAGFDSHAFNAKLTALSKAIPRTPKAPSHTSEMGKSIKNDIINSVKLKLKNTASRLSIPATAQALGHLWYTDKIIGNFIKTVQQNYPNSLFAITGDHFGRKHINATPSFYESSTVPFILYGNQIKRYYGIPKNSAGGHLDIVPTLLELVAPKGFTYYSLGRSLLSPSSLPNLGFGLSRIITDKLIATAFEEVERFDPSPVTTEQKDEFFQALERYHQARDLSWRYILKGDALF